MDDADLFEVSAKAKAKLEDAFAGRAPKPMRVDIVLGACGGQRLELTLDKLRPSDHVFQADGFTFVMEEELVEEAAPFRVDVGRVGFVVHSRLRCGARECGDCLQ